MKHKEYPRTIPEAVKVASFPVYGVVGNVFDLSITSFGVGISHLARFMSISFMFTSPRFSSASIHSARSQSFNITSIDATAQDVEREHMIFEMEDLPEPGWFDEKVGPLWYYHFNEEEKNKRVIHQSGKKLSLSLMFPFQEYSDIGALLFTFLDSSSNQRKVF